MGFFFFAFSHNPDTQPYHGWVFAYKYDFVAMKFVQLYSFCTTPNDSQGGVWQGGQGISTDGKFIYFNVGNGNFVPTRNSYGMCVIKMSQDLQVVDYFTPAQWKRYSNSDEDVSGCGNMQVPGTPYIFVAVTKYGGAHLIDTRNMGKFNAGNDSCKQSIILSPHIIFPGGNPVGWFDGKKARMYAWAPELPLFQFTYDSATDSIAVPPPNWNTLGSAGLFVSSNGPNNAILWAFTNHGHLYAFDGTKDVSAGPIWRDESNNISPGASWTWPTVVNGRVYVPVGDGSIVIYGLK